MDSPAIFHKDNYYGRLSWLVLATRTIRRRVCERKIGTAIVVDNVGEPLK